MLYSFVGGLPGQNLGSLAGLNPSSGGVFTYTASGLMLSSLTQYFIVVTASTPVAGGFYNWSFENSGSAYSIDRWISGFSYLSADGANWTIDSHNVQFAIYATPIPEPSSTCLILIGSGVLFYARRKP